MARRNWTYVAWGLYHGVLLILGRVTGRFWRALYEFTGVSRFDGVARAIDVGCTFLTVSVGWILFRSASLTEAGAIMAKIATHLLVHVDQPFYEIRMLLKTCLTYLSPFELAVAVTAIVVLEIGDTVQGQVAFRPWLARRPAPLRWTAYFALVTVILICGQFDGPPFIYFQF